jgi:hypothetical protein
MTNLLMWLGFTRTSIKLMGTSIPGTCRWAISQATALQVMPKRAAARPLPIRY